MTDEEYRDSMEFPMENLCVAMWGVTSDAHAGASDAEFVEIATRKIQTLKRMILATGFSETMLQAIMEE